MIDKNTATTTHDVMASDTNLHTMAEIFVSVYCKMLNNKHC